MDTGFNQTIRQNGQGSAIKLKGAGRSYLWFLRTERGGQIYHLKNAVGAGAADSR